MEIDEDEAEVIRLIFHKYVDEGYGAQRLSHYLHEQGIKSRDGKGFPNTTVNRIIKNIAYTGIIKNGESQSGYIDELRIIDVSTFSKAQEIMRQRTLPHGNVPLNCKGKSLLVGNIFCAHCGNRLTLTTSGRRVYRADGTVKYEPRMRYQCHYNVRHPGECDGQSGYGVTKLDGIVEKVIRMKFAEIAAAPESEILNHQHKKEIELARIKLDQANAHLAEKQKDLSDYKAETLKVIRGQSNLSVELLNALVKETETMIALAQTRIDAAQAEYESLLASAENLRQEIAYFREEEKEVAELFARELAWRYAGSEALEWGGAVQRPFIRMRKFRPVQRAIRLAGKDFSEVREAVEQYAKEFDGTWKQLLLQAPGSRDIVTVSRHRLVCRLGYAGAALELYRRRYGGYGAGALCLQLCHVRRRPRL